MITLVQSKLIICDNIERHSTDPTQSIKYKNGGFFHAIAQVIAFFHAISQAIARLNVENTPTFVHGSSSTPHPGYIDQLYHTDYQQHVIDSLQIDDPDSILNVYGLDESSFLDDDAKFLTNAITEISRDIFGPRSSCSIFNFNVRYNTHFIFNV